LVQNHKQFPKYKEDHSTGQSTEPAIKLLDNSFKQFNMYSSIIRQISEESSRQGSKSVKSSHKPIIERDGISPFSHKDRSRDGLNNN